MKRTALVDRIGLPFGAVGNGTGGRSLFGPYFDTIRALGAVSHWTLSEVAGNFVDIISGHDAVVTGAPTRGVAGPLTGAQNRGAVTWLAGTFAQAADHTDLDLADGPYTLVWFSNRLVDSGAWEVLLSKGTGAYAIGIDPTDHMSALRDNVAQLALETGASLAPTGWDWWVYSRTINLTQALYKNGANVTNPTAGSVCVDTANALQFGRDEVGDPPFLGQMAEVSIFKGIALTPANVAVLNAVR